MQYSVFISLVFVSLFASSSQACSPHGDGCWWLDPCCGGLSCHPGIHKCYHSPRRLNEPCSLGYSCGGDLVCLAGVHRCREKRSLGQSCHATAPCKHGLSCQPGVHKCYHIPRRLHEPCVAGHACGSGLSCQPGVQKCYHTPRRLNEPCAIGHECGSGLSCHPGVQKCYDVPRKVGQACSAGYPCGQTKDAILQCKPFSHTCANVQLKDVVPSDQTYSNPVPPNKNFSMIVMSDVQYGYTDCSGAGNILNDTGREDECIYGADLPSNVPDAEAERRLKILIEANKRMVEYGETLISSAPSGTFKGIILNGDMVNYGDSEHLSEYMKLFDDPHAPLSVPVYSSVGNHDVDFGTDDQMMTMSLYFVDYLKRMQSKGLLRSLDGSTTGTFYDVSKARNERHHVGSWSYAFDMGKYTFLQLNNVAFTSDPQRTDRFKKVLANWNGAAAREDYFYFTDAAPWFIKELDLATRRGQHVVLMSHAHYEFQAMLNKPENCEIAKAIAKSSVFVYIAGHIHTRVGKLLNLTLGKGAIKIPVLFAGSPFWEKFVHLDFRADGSGLNFKVADSKRSEPVCDPAVFGCRTVDGVSGFIPTKQDTWTCNKGYFGTKDGCDCGCGMVDPDCLCPGALLYCQNGRSRSNSRCDLITNSCVVK